MASSVNTTYPLASVELGDLVTTPDGRTLAVRSVNRSLPRPVGGMAGWVLLGEIGPQCVAVSLPEHPAGDAVMYAPLPRVPSHAHSAREVFSGVVSYWSPHLPGMSGAMGELGYKVCEVRGSADPMLLLWRGNELVVFVKSAQASPDAFQVSFAPRDASLSERDVVRVSARLTSADRAGVDVSTASGVSAPLR